jgi:hypothetical protein
MSAAQITPKDPVGVERLTATVASVVGSVQVRDNEDAAWRTPKAGESLPVGGECRTGPKSSITLTMPPEQIITLDRLGTVKLLEAIRGQDTLKTDLGMKYGRVRYQIEAAGISHDSTIRSPSSALAIRGSDVTKFDDGLGSGIIVNKGLADVPNVNRDRVTLGTSKDASYGNRAPVITHDDVSPGEYAEKQASTPYVDSNSLSRAEQQVTSYNTNVIGQGANIQEAHSPAETGGNLINPGAFTIGVGKLQFRLSWSGDSGTGAPDLDLFVISPRHETLRPSSTGSASVPSGGIIAENNRGGKGTSAGTEAAVWAATYPLGVYQYGVRYVGSGDPANFRILVYQNDKQINANFTDTVTEDRRDESFTINVRPLPAASTQNAAAASRVHPPAARANSSAPVLKVSRAKVP